MPQCHFQIPFHMHSSLKLHQKMHVRQRWAQTQRRASESDAREAPVLRGSRGLVHALGGNNTMCMYNTYIDSTTTSEVPITHYFIKCIHLLLYQA